MIVPLIEKTHASQDSKNSLKETLDTIIVQFDDTNGQIAK